MCDAAGGVLVGAAGCCSLPDFPLMDNAVQVFVLDQSGPKFL